jgi:hypothetical protein
MHSQVFCREKMKKYSVPSKDFDKEQQEGSGIADRLVCSS